MATIEQLTSLARRITGQRVQVEFGERISVNGDTITLVDPGACWTNLPAAAQDAIGRFTTAKAAHRIRQLGREAAKRDLPSLTAEEYYDGYDSMSPNAESVPFVRRVLDQIDATLLDAAAAKDVGDEARQQTTRFFAWNRFEGRTKPLAEVEREEGGAAMAFLEAVNQLQVLGQILESFHSLALEQAARTASKAIDQFGQGSMSREQALEQVLRAMASYCPPSWILPPEYVSPQGEPSDGEESDSPGNAPGGSEPGEEGEGEGEGEGQPTEAEGSGKGDGEGQGQPSQKSDPSEKESKAPPKATDQNKEGRGANTGEGAAPQKLDKRYGDIKFDDPELDAFYRALERIVAARSKGHGRGRPRYETWGPGDILQSPDELMRYMEGDTYGVDPLERVSVLYRDEDVHLIAVFLDSSGSVGNELFSRLYRVIGAIAQKVLDIPGCYLGVGQFSGGASWVLKPTRDISQIYAFAEQKPTRLYSGSTVVGEIYKILPEDFRQFRSADLPCLTDGQVENGPELVKALQAAHVETNCAIKLHGMVFKRDKESTIKQLEAAKKLLPEHIRIWHLG